MQNSIFYLTIVTLTLFLFSCKSENKSTATTEPTIAEMEEEGTLVSLNIVNAAEIPALVASATSILEHRIKEDTNGSWAAIEDGVWEYEAIFANGEMSKPDEVAGKWIDFKNDNTYQFGEKANIKGKGKYHYTPDTDLLLMVNDNKNEKPIEYKVKIAGDVMVFTGSPEYKDNGTQGKLKKVQQIPS